MSKRIVIVYNSAWGIYNFRSELIKSLIKMDFVIYSVAPADEYVSKLTKIGVKHYDIRLTSKSKNIFHELKYIKNLTAIFLKIKPHLVLNFTAKPNIYSTLICGLFRIKTINNIAGLGIGFTKKDYTYYLLIFFYKVSQSCAFHIFFQNRFDKSLFLNKGIVKDRTSSILPGSGVNIKKFEYKKNIFNSKIKFLFMSRMLKSKGIKILFDAAKILHDIYNIDFEVYVIGEFVEDSIDALDKKYIEIWKNYDYFNYFGKTDNVKKYIVKSNCVVLPSYYREGTPRSLLEALSVGRPIITTDMPGCIDTVVNNKNGFIINPKDSSDLANKMRKFINLPINEKIEFGKESRKIAEKKFDEKIVIKRYTEKINLALSR